MEGRAANVGLPFRSGGFHFQHLVLPLADHLEAFPLGALRRLLVEIDGNAQLGEVPLAEGAGKGDALLHGNAPDGREGDHVHRPDSRVGTLVGVHVDGRHGRPGRPDEGVRHRLRLAREAHHEAVMVGVRPVIEKGASLHSPEIGGDGLDDVLPPSLAEIRHTLDKFSCHDIGPPASESNIHSGHIITLNFVQPEG
ncbi:hypothetical protein SDC9_45456 [bioreactor metagenome]|uniref:Uncharacterized protein n=1 Tax=bioreactor metagenome TaxID=1076179 RepID=A0A644W658_9ZZZZ